MSSFTFYDSSIPMFKEIIESLQVILKKGSEAPNAASLPEARIIEDMLPLSVQVHFVTDFIQKFVARASGTEPLDFEKNLKTFDDFFQRIKKVEDILAKADKELINKRVDEDVPLGLGPDKDAKMLLRNFLSGVVIPNVFFHLITAYDIMRKEGVPLGKMDFLSPFLSKHLGA
ncbi:hypothetical protein E4U55_001216 [Claviceps digitariae]|nr:hypothetical protein E4U55_001216 [Claviceps digitariae]